MFLSKGEGPALWRATPWGDMEASFIGEASSFRVASGSVGAWPAFFSVGALSFLGRAFLSLSGGVWTLLSPSGGVRSARGFSGLVLFLFYHVVVGFSLFRRIHLRQIGCR